MSNKPGGFVSLRSLKQRPPADRQKVLEEIRTIYFRTRKQTIEHDLAHAIALLKTLPTEEDREKARAYMDGLSQMRGEWARTNRKSGKRGRS